MSCPSPRLVAQPLRSPVRVEDELEVPKMSRLSPGLVAQLLRSPVRVEDDLEVPKMSCPSPGLVTQPLRSPVRAEDELEVPKMSCPSPRLVTQPLWGPARAEDELEVPKMSCPSPGLVTQPLRGLTRVEDELEVPVWLCSPHLRCLPRRPPGTGAAPLGAQHRELAALAPSTSTPCFAGRFPTGLEPEAAGWWPCPGEEPFLALGDGGPGRGASPWVKALRSSRASTPYPGHRSGSGVGLTLPAEEPKGKLLSISFSIFFLPPQFL